MEEIKPCPCCGDVAWQAENKKGTKICIQCLNPDCGLRTAWYLTYIEALGAWNKRPLPVENSAPGYIWPWSHESREAVVEELQRKNRIIESIKVIVGVK